MKSVLTIITFFVAVAALAIDIPLQENLNSDNLESDVKLKCPQPYLSELSPINLNNFLGIWYIVRSTPCEEHNENSDPECLTQALWKSNDSPENQIKSLCSSRANGSYTFMEGTANVKPISGSTLGLVSAQWNFEIMNMTVTSVFVDSDGGQNWAIEHVCFDSDMEMGKESSNATVTSMWTVMSRTRRIDAKLEQTLVEKIEKYSGLTQDKLRGITQTNCYENQYD